MSIEFLIAIGLAQRSAGSLINLVINELSSNLRKIYFDSQDFG